MHPPRIHAYPARKVRNPQSGENDRIRVISLRCEASRLKGHPYTVRILPEFLIPGSVIRLDRLLEVAAHPEFSTNQLCLNLGCIDRRTVRNRLAGLADAVNAVSLDLSHCRSNTPELGDLPTGTPDTDPIVRCRELYEKEMHACEREGSRSAMLPPFLHLIQAAMGKQRGKRPSSYASQQAHPP